MGYSISEETYQRLERNRREGRLCGGATRVRHGCVARATQQAIQETWTHKIGEGESHVSPLSLCARHARQVAPGYEGVNFRVLSVEPWSPRTSS